MGLCIPRWALSGLEPRSRKRTLARGVASRLTCHERHWRGSRKATFRPWSVTSFSGMALCARNSPAEDLSRRQGCEGATSLMRVITRPHDQDAPRQPAERVLVALFGPDRRSPSEPAVSRRASRPNRCLIPIDRQAKLNLSLANQGSSAVAEIDIDFQTLRFLAAGPRSCARLDLSQSADAPASPSSNVPLE
jgi:hypothetical protein